jgi:hypothetical protein
MDGEYMRNCGGLLRLGSWYVVVEIGGVGDWEKVDGKTLMDML